jgi:hypothetical protein
MVKFHDPVVVAGGRDEIDDDDDEDDDGEGEDDVRHLFHVIANTIGSVDADPRRLDGTTTLTVIEEEEEEETDAVDVGCGEDDDDDDDVADVDPLTDRLEKTEEQPSPSPSSSVSTTERDVRGLRYDDLRKLAKTLGVDTKGSKEALIGRVIAAQSTADGGPASSSS